MSETSKNDGHLTENNSTAAKPKKKERRQKAKNQTGNETKTSAADKEHLHDENEKAVNQNDEAGTSAAAMNAVDLIDEAKLKSILDEAYKYKNNPNILPLLRDAAKTPQEAMQKSYKFWSTQPVPKFDEVIEKNEPIEANKKIEDIRAEPYALPEGFKWDTMKLDDPLVLTELYTLLNENYVEDDDAMFRFDYQPDFLKWALQPPGWRQDWHVGVRVVKSGLLVGFISAIPGQIRIYDKAEKIVEINFLCVHKKLRSKRVAPVLIREITRRVNLTGIFQAVYTAGVVLPKPIATCRYWHRSLNPKKLIQIKFSSLSRNMTMQRTIKLYKLPDAPLTSGFRQMTKKDVPQAHKLLEKYLKGFKLTPNFSEEEFKHWFLPKNGIISSYVVADPNGTITDLVSYYALPSTVMHHPTHKLIRAAYSFYNVSTKTPWCDLMNDALIAAKADNFDVFNALDVMDNTKFLRELKFGIGDGNLQYYLFNWRCPNMKPEEMGLILL